MRPTDAPVHPGDWGTATVGGAVEIKRGISWSKEQEHAQPRDDRVPVIRIGNVQARLELDDLLYLSGLKPAAVRKKRVAAGWTIIVGSNGNRARIGNAVLIRNDDDFLFASFLIGTKPKDDSELRPDYFYRWLSSERVQSYLSASSEGTTGLNNLSHSFFRAMAIPVPSRSEQAAIARVLDAVDAALERASAAVERARELRRGLLQAAFEFVDSQEPRKDSDSGRIPRSWDAIKGKQAFAIVTGGCSSVDALRLPRDREVPDSWFMKVDDFNGRENRRAIVRTKIGFRAVDNRLFKVLPPGHLVIAKRGAAILKNRVRITAVPIALDPNLMALQVLPGMRAEFLRYQLEWRNLSRYVEDSGVPQLNNKDLYPRYFLRAPDERQQEIIETVAAAEAVEDALISKCGAFEDLKKSLMHDLLTGRVRVTEPTTEAAS
jgi:type I restriction enzyme S subunit